MAEEKKATAPKKAAPKKVAPKYFRRTLELTPIHKRVSPIMSTGAGGI